MRVILSLLEQQDVEMPVEVCGEPASVKRGADAVADSEERARLRPRAEGKRGQKHDTQDVVEPQAWTKARLGNVEAVNLSQIWRKRSRISRRQFLWCVALLRFKQARARVRMFLSLLQAL